LKDFKNILLISGSGRNCGKTTLACNIIRLLSETEDVFALKISPHFHQTGNKQKLIFEGLDYRIFRETDMNSNKDSSRMLKAGAKDVFFIQSEDNKLIDVYDSLKKHLPENSPIVCESGSFANVFKPGYHILVKANSEGQTKKSFSTNLDKANIIVSQKDFTTERLNFCIQYSKLNWTINKLDND
jgi:hypothetical protein